MSDQDDAREQAIRERLEKATGGRWSAARKMPMATHCPIGKFGDQAIFVPNESITGETIADEVATDKANAAFVVGAREDIPYLLAALASARAETAALADALEEMIAAEAHDQRCRIVAAGGCDCGAADARAEARANGNRALRRSRAEGNGGRA